MPLIFQKMIFRADVQANRQALYVFGDNCLRKGLGGQAREMRGESNAVGVRTKKRPDNDPSSFFTDAEFDENCRLILEDLRLVFDALKENRIVVMPADGLGTGLSDLPGCAPKTFAFLESSIAGLGGR